MKSSNISSLRPWAFATALLLSGVGTASAATWTQDFATCSNGSKVSNAGAYSAWDPCGSGTTSDVRVGAVATSGSTVINASVYSWGGSGLGVVNTNEDPNATGPHAVDSYGGIDALVLNFASTVSLSSFKIGWNGTDNPYNGYNDSDISVYAWTGTGSGPSTYDKSNASWQLIGNYFDVGASNGIGNTADKQGGTAGVSTSTFSSYWLISAMGNSDGKIDAFKLLSVSGMTSTPPTGVPEPGSIALLGLSALGLMAVRRKSKVLS
jgi:PEP-CTERM motif